mmetsp:Transcript_95973/g.293562  ORF Transcript_95973/g.293562 Transcript_95973/m.293562 type:complete len:312 (+) Transcript_95973:436-1371(+)
MGERVHRDCADLRRGRRLARVPQGAEGGLGLRRQFLRPCAARSSGRQALGGRLDIGLGLRHAGVGRGPGGAGDAQPRRDHTPGRRLLLRHASGAARVLARAYAENVWQGEVAFTGPRQPRLLQPGRGGVLRGHRRFAPSECVVLRLARHALADPRARHWPFEQRQPRADRHDDVLDTRPGILGEAAVGIRQGQRPQDDHDVAPPIVLPRRVRGRGQRGAQRGRLRPRRAAWHVPMAVGFQHEVGGSAGQPAAGRSPGGQHQVAEPVPARIVGGRVCVVLGPRARQHVVQAVCGPGARPPHRERVHPGAEKP